jgi:hypothetical protein
MATRQYSPKQVVADWAGILLSGFADDTFIKVTMNSDDWTQYVGSDGEVVEVASADDTGEIEITLNSQTPVNDALMAKRLQDKLDGTGSGPFSIRDLTTGRLIHSVHARIKRMPDQEFAKGHSPRTWTFICSDVVPAFAAVG